MRTKDEIEKAIIDYKGEFNELMILNFDKKYVKKQAAKRIDEIQNNIQILKWVLKTSEYLPF